MMESEDGCVNFPSKWCEFPNKNDVFSKEAPKFMQIQDLETFSIQSISTLL